jgi:hypothetical protein
LKFRPSKIGRPKGSRNKIQRAKHIDQRQFTLEPVQRFDFPIDLEYDATLPPVAFSPFELTKSAHLHYTTNTNEPPQSSGVVLHFGVMDTSTPQHCQYFGGSRSATHFAAVVPTPPEHALPALLDDFGAPSPDGARLFGRHDPHDPSIAAVLDAVAPAHGAPGSADPFHFDWPHW